MNRSTRAIFLIVTVTIISIAIIALDNPFSNPIVIEEPTSTLDNSIPVGTNLGQRASDFTLKTLDGGTVTLSELRGKPVLINFWATWCSFCVEELSDFETIHQQVSDKIIIIAINRAESLEKQQEFLLELGADLTFTLALDPNDRIAQLYGVRVMPTSYILDSDGVIVAKKFGKLSLNEMLEGVEQAV